MTDEQAGIMLSIMQRVEAGQERLESRQGDLNVQLGKFEGLLENLDGRLERFGGLLENLVTRMENVESRLDKVESRLDGIEAGQIKLRTELSMRIDRLQEAVVHMKDDITVNFGRADYAQRLAAGLREDMRAFGGAIERGRGEVIALSEVMSAMERQSRRLVTLVESVREEVAAAGLAARAA